MGQIGQFCYFYGMQADTYSFYRIPKILFTDKIFKLLSCEAKVLYGLMLDRMSLSIKNKWFDEQGRVYIIFTVQEVRDYMGCCRQTAINLLVELDGDKAIGLIEKKKLGFGKRFGDKQRILTSRRAPESQEVYTPHYAVSPIVKYIPKNMRIWCPFDS